MYLAEATDSRMLGQTGLWLLAVFLLGLLAMAWLTIREAGLHEGKAAVRKLRRKPNIPEHEKLSLASRFSFFLQCVIWGGGGMAPVKDVIDEDQYDFEFRLRKEIDKLVGKEVYHGRKEQLKPPSRPSSD